MEVFRSEKNTPSGSDRKLTIEDVARALGVSKTTVSRAISGKGRVGNDTRERVLAFIAENDYKPNVIARGLAQQKTYNIALLIPGDCNLVDMPFFQNSMQGICEEASAGDYDVMLVTATSGNNGNLERMVRNNKVDGVILSRSMVKDSAAEYLKEKNIPFVLMGTSRDEGIIQVDNDHRSGCRMLVERILGSGMERVGIIGGSMEFMVNLIRLQGYKDAFAGSGRDLPAELVFGGCTSPDDVEEAVKKLIEERAECIVCMDDAICLQALRVLSANKIKVPQQMKLASFYDSSLLCNNKPSISSVMFDDKALGRLTCSVLLQYIQGGEVQARTLLGYKVIERESTGKVLEEYA